MIGIQLNLFDPNPCLYGLVWMQRRYWDDKLKMFVWSFDVQSPCLFSSKKKAEKARQELKKVIKDRKYKRKGICGIGAVFVQPIPVIELQRMATALARQINL